MDVHNTILLIFLQSEMLSTIVSKAMCAWMETSLEESRHSIQEHTSLSTALEGKWQPRGESKEKQTLILFKEELSNNLCSPKMELADWEVDVFQQSRAAICQGRGSGLSTQHEHRLQQQAYSASEDPQYRVRWPDHSSDHSSWKNETLGEDVANSFNLRLCLLSF